MYKRPFVCVLLAWPILSGLPPASAAPVREGSWHVELESRADSADKGKVTYRLLAAQGLVQPESKPVLTVSSETLTYAPAPKVTVIKYLSGEFVFRAPDLTCDSVTMRLLAPPGASAVADKPAPHFRPDFLAAAFSFQVKVPRGFHYVTGSAHSGRVPGLLPGKPSRAFVKPPRYAANADAVAPHLLTLLLPAPEPRAVGSGFEAPYAVEFALAPD